MSDQPAQQLAIVDGINFDDDQLPAPRKEGTEVRESSYAPTITVICPDKKKVRVAASAAAARAQAQITACRLASLLNKKIEEYEKAGKVPSLMDLKRMTEIASIVTDMEISTFERKKLPTEIAMQEFGKQAVAMIGAAAKGGAEGASGGGWREKMERIKSLRGAKTVNAEVVTEATKEIK